MLGGLLVVGWIYLVVLFSRRHLGIDAELREAIAAGHPHAGDELSVSFEFFPPADDKGEARLWDTVEKLSPLRPEWYSVTYGAGGSTQERTDRIVRRILQETERIKSLGDELRDQITKAFEEIRTALADGARDWLGENQSATLERINEETPESMRKRALIDALPENVRVSMATELRDNHFSTHLDGNLTDPNFEIIAQFGFSATAENALSDILDQVLDRAVVANRDLPRIQTDRGVYLRRLQGDKLLIEGLSFSLPPGGIVGVIGPNGAGKTTLLRMITGEEQPDAGTVEIGDTVDVAYVDQSRDALDGEKTVWEEISGGHDHLEVGNWQVASRAYCGRFNFKGPDQQKKLKDLSGGERNRVHLAKLLKSGGNLLLLDEPTNDLDVETLRALEQALLDFPGSAVVVSHDRWFLDRISTHTLAFEETGEVFFFEGSYSEYEQDRKRRLGSDADQPHRPRFKRLDR